MGNSCCTGTGDEKPLELDTNAILKQNFVKKSGGSEDAKVAKSVLTIQKWIRGNVTRQLVKDRYGFVGSTHLLNKQKGTLSEAQVQEAR